MRIILASQSRFRKHALDILGLRYETVVSHFDESSIQHDNPSELARLLSEAKAKTIGESENNALVIAADLFIVHNNSIFGKPKDVAEATSMLKKFSGQSFEIVSGLAVYNNATKKCLTETASCTVKFRTLSDFEINDYITHHPITTYAGAFEADGLLRFAESINGNYHFRAGLPVDKLILFLRENGIKV